MIGFYLGGAALAAALEISLLGKMGKQYGSAAVGGVLTVAAWPVAALFALFTTFPRWRRKK